MEMIELDKYNGPKKQQIIPFFYSLDILHEWNKDKKQQVTKLTTSYNKWWSSLWRLPLPLKSFY